MNRKEAIARLKKVEEEIFYINMIDMWKDKDREALRQYEEEKEELEAIINE